MIETIIQAIWLVLSALIPLIPLAIIAVHDYKTKTITNKQLILLGLCMLPMIAYHWIFTGDLLTNMATAAGFSLALYFLYKSGKAPSGDVLLLLPFPFAFAFFDCLYLAGIAILAHLIISFIIRKKETGAHAFAPAVLIGYAFLTVPSAVFLIPQIIEVLLLI